MGSSLWSANAPQCQPIVRIEPENEQSPRWIGRERKQKGEADVGRDALKTNHLRIPSDPMSRRRSQQRPACNGHQDTPEQKAGVPKPAMAWINSFVDVVNSEDLMIDNAFYHIEIGPNQEALSREASGLTNEDAGDVLRARG